MNGSPVSVEPTGIVHGYRIAREWIGQGHQSRYRRGMDRPSVRMRVNFTVLLESEYYVKILQPEGGTISVSYTKEG